MFVTSKEVGLCNMLNGRDVFAPPVTNDYRKVFLNEINVGYVQSYIYTHKPARFPAV